jgi:hypothetical protein
MTIENFQRGGKDETSGQPFLYILTPYRLRIGYWILYKIVFDQCYGM